MWSVAGSALAPSCVMVWPFTVTRPEVINSSALRREAMPAAAMIFCKRSWAMALLARFGSRLFGSCLFGSLFGRFGYIRHARRISYRRVLEKRILLVALRHLLELFHAREFSDVLQAEAKQKILGGLIKDGASHHRLAAGSSDQLAIDQGRQHAGGIHAAYLRDLRGGDRLLVGDDG